MKKTLIALAVLAASGTAFAQSTVTIYGKLDQGFARGIGADDFLCHKLLAAVWASVVLKTWAVA